MEVYDVNKINDDIIELVMIQSQTTEKCNFTLHNDGNSITLNLQLAFEMCC